MLMNPLALAPARRRRTTTSRRLHGIALIEVLVALLIFMLGVLGLVGLQTSMTRAQTEAKVRADAAALANELVGRMWTDLDNVVAYNATGCATQARCSEWQGKVRAGLPGGAGAVAVDSGTGDVTVTITWATPGGDAHKYVTNTTVAKAST